MTGLLEMKHKFLILAWAAMVVALASCSKEEEKTEEVVDEPATEEVEFAYGQGQYSGVVLPYRKAMISASGEGKSSLVLYLHGGTSKGTDNEAPVKEKGVETISSYLASNHIKAMFVVPQCPKDKSWGGSMNEVLSQLIADCVASGTVDTGRIYLMGGSMGGSGTWSMLSAYPSLFAAAMPVAGNPAGCIAANVASTPVLTVMGTSDRIMNIDVVEAFVNQLVGLKDDAVLEIENGWTHEVTCTESYTDTRLDWLFGHTRQK